MANIIKVDYEAIPRQTMSMRTQGKELNTELLGAYRSIEEMHRSWFGQRYNALVAEFNKIVPSINELLSLVIDEIPFTLDTVANNYALADKGTGVTKAAKEVPQKILEISMPSDIGMGFITSEVEAVQQSVSRSFQNARDKMNVIETEYGKIVWQSEASEAFKVKFQKLKTEITNSFENLNTQFTNLMNATKEDMQKTENANNINS